MWTGVCSVSRLRLGLLHLRQAFRHLSFPRFLCHILLRPMGRLVTCHGLTEAAQAAMRRPQEPAVPHGLASNSAGP